jgi:hypothetical protein
MKIFIQWTAFFLLSTLLLSGAQDIVLTAPKSQTPDRVISLKPVFTLDGEGAEGFFLKEPSAPLWPRDGENLLFTDQDQVLLFDKNGKLLKNLFKKGEGPGEWGYTMGVSAHEGGLAVMSMMPNKCLLFDKGYQFVREIRFEKPQSMLRLLDAGPEGGHFFSTDIDFARIKTGTSPYLSVLKQFDPAGKVTASPLGFSYKVYTSVIKNKDRIMAQMEMLEPFLYAVIGQRVLLAHRSDYALDLIDVKTQKVLKVLTRQVKHQPWRLDKDENRPEGAPAIEYFNDILAVVSHGDTFWVFGSDLDPKKGVHVDVLSAEGEYLDRFWLPLPDCDHPKRFGQSQIALSRNRLAWIHRDEDENQMVSVYELKL